MNPEDLKAEAAELREGGTRMELTVWHWLLVVFVLLAFAAVCWYRAR